MCFSVQIHVVKQGDTLWAIAAKYNSTPQQIADINQLSQQKYLIEGQALIILPQEQMYVVKSGDSLYSISRMYGVSVDSIIQANQIQDANNLQVGTKLIIPVESKQYGYIETNGYIEPSTTAKDVAIIKEAGEYLTYLSPFSYQVTADGGLITIDDQPIINASLQTKTAPLMVITNFGEGNFDTSLANKILNDDALIDTLIKNVIGIMRSKGYYGLNIDFERINPDDRQAYNDFLQKFVDALHPLGYVVTTALAPKPEDYTEGAWYGAHDYKAHGEIVDFVIIMTYEWGWSGGPPYAVAPVDLVEDVIKYAVSVIPPEKIMMGMPLYGYDWTLPYEEGGKWARRIGPQNALLKAAEKGAVIEFDEQTQTPFFTYFDEDSNEHVVWFEDARSVRSKLMLVNKYGLRGVSYWLLGQEFPQNWIVLDNMFNIVKVID